MSIKSPFRRKIADIRWRYGDKAVEHFLKFPRCQKCPERRIVCLAIHHVAGKKQEIFETLCQNCHMAHHSHKSGNYTAEDEAKVVSNRMIRKKKIAVRNKKILEAIDNGGSYRKVAGKFGVSHVLIYQMVRDR